MAWEDDWPVDHGLDHGADWPGRVLFVDVVLFAALAAYTAYRMTRRRRTPDAQGTFTPISPTSSVIPSGRPGEIRKPELQC